MSKMAEPNNPSEDELEQKIRQANPSNPIAEGNDTNPANPESQKKEVPKKPKTTLESVVDETSNLFGSALKLGLAGAIPYTFANYIAPSMKTDTAILAGAQVASDYTTSLQKGKKYSPGNLLESAAIGTSITCPLESMFSVVNKMPLNTPLDYVAKAG